MHVADETGEHFFALPCLAGLTNYLKIESILDLDSGTGRSVKYLKKICPKISIFLGKKIVDSLKIKLIFPLQMGIFWKKSPKYRILKKNLSTLINHNFLPTEPILNVKDVLESHESESLISGI